MCHVSVIIPTRNRCNLLRRAIDSVLGQTYGDMECIVVDDSSTDETPDLLKEFDDERLVCLRHERRRHASAARNTGIAHARGELIAFLDDDDEWLPSKLDKQVSLLSRAPRIVGMVYCWLDYIQGEKTVKRHSPRLRGSIFKETLDKQPIGNSSTLLVRRDVFKKSGLFDESLPRGNDGDFIRRVCRYWEVDYVPEVMVKVHIGHGLDQITAYDENGIKKHILAQLIKLQKFQDDFYRCRKQAANVYADIACHYGWLNQWRRSIRFYWKATWAFPFSRKLHACLIRSLKHALRPKRHRRP